MRDSEGDRSPDPNGFNFYFLRKCSEIAGKDVVNFVQEFHGSAKLPMLDDMPRSGGG